MTNQSEQGVKTGEQIGAEIKTLKNARVREAAKLLLEMGLKFDHVGDGGHSVEFLFRKSATERGTRVGIRLEDIDDHNRTLDVDPLQEEYRHPGATIFEQAQNGKRYIAANEWDAWHMIGRGEDIYVLADYYSDGQNNEQGSLEIFHRRLKQTLDLETRGVIPWPFTIRERTLWYR